VILLFKAELRKRLNRYGWTELPIPNEVIAQVHHLAIAAEKYDGIVFTNLDGRKLPDQFDDDNHQYDATNSTEGHNNGNTSDTNDDEENEGSTGIPQQAESEEDNVYDGNESNSDGDKDINEGSDREEDIVTEDVVTGEAYKENTEDPYENRITINYINIVSEMNTSQMANQQEEQEQNSDLPAHTYNLRTRPTKQNGRISLAISIGNGNGGDDENVETETTWQYVTIHPKVHAHVMLTQMNVLQELLTFGKKEVRQFQRNSSNCTRKGQ